MSLEDAEQDNRRAYAGESARIDALTAALNDGRAKYTYFLLAVAGAALGYGLQKLDGQIRNWVAWLAMFADLCWVISILCGCLSIESTHEVQSMNVRSLKTDLVAQLSPLIKAWNQLEKPVLERAISRVLKQSSWLKRFQFWLLILGVVIFAFWRVIAWWQSTAATLSP